MTIFGIVIVAFQVLINQALRELREGLSSAISVESHQDSVGTFIHYALPVVSDELDMSPQESLRLTGLHKLVYALTI